MEINKVTITGADNNSSVEKIIELSRKYPFVEWGILFSESRVGSDRYPSFEWIKNLIANDTENILKLSGHICGKYCKEFLSNGPDFIKNISPEFKTKKFKRFQLNYNFKTNINDIDLVYFLNRVDHHKKLSDVNFILQYNDSNKHFIEEVVLKYIKHKDKYFHYLFDSSGGNGILKEWQEPLKEVYCGYAGGLNPENIVLELNRINQLVNDNTVWVDVESGVRTNNKLDFDKVESFLIECKKYI